MHKRQMKTVIAVAACCLLALLAVAVAAEAQTATPPATATADPAETAPTPKRGCEDCHAPGSQYSLYAGAMAFDGHPPIKAGEMADYQSCMGCHRATGKHPMAEIAHPVHLFSGVFLDKYTGNCFSCHIVENGEFLIVPGTTQTKANGIFAAEPEVVRPGEAAGGAGDAVESGATPAQAPAPQSGAPGGDGVPDDIPPHHPPFDCAYCHATGAGAAAAWPSDHASIPESQCQDCHQVAQAAPTPLDRMMDAFLEIVRRP